MQQEAFQKIIQSVADGTATDEEISQYLNWYHSFEPAEDVWVEMKTDPSVFRSSLLNRIKEEIGAAGQEQLPVQQISGTPAKSGTALFRWVAGIAAAVATVIFGLYFFNYRNQDVERVLGVNDVAPARQGTVLYLASGKKISLTGVANGKLLEEPGIRISKSAAGELVYELSGKTDKPGEPNTLSTGKGETFKLKLPDGSMIWLNSASSLTYQSDLLKNGRREVSLAGEAYFEVAKDREHPFIVKSRNQEVTVLGTHFNVNSYENEPVVSTTLLEGSVRIAAGNAYATIAPGQQAVRSNGGLSVKQVNAESFLAWQKNQFMFERQNIAAIMRMIERWYDVEVIYQGKPVTATFSGGISRFDNLYKVLRSLESTDKVKFEIEGRIVYVRN